MPYKTDIFLKKSGRQSDPPQAQNLASELLFKNA
jgi:hypothetical protein